MKIAAEKPSAETKLNRRQLVKRLLTLARKLYIQDAPERSLGNSTALHLPLVSYVEESMASTPHELALRPASLHAHQT